jgi:hypothetical protein
MDLEGGGAEEVEVRRDAGPEVALQFLVIVVALDVRSTLVTCTRLDKIGK